jgi:1,4-alpha-glucan branching enzyme
LESARAQIRLGIQAYREHLGRNPPGIWLPECGFVPGIDRLLAEEGLSYFFVDSHAVEFAEPSPVFATYSPIVCPSAVFAFPRDLESSAQVWSSEFGYPGDGRYREFYRDIGHDLPEHDLAPFLLPNGGRKNVGIKYHRITGREVQLRDKEPYHRGWALEAVEQHAEHFVRSRMMQMDWWNQRMDRPPIVVAPYDAELFGHWWFEGPEFLDLVVRKVAAGQFPFRLSSPTDAMACGLEFQVAMPARSSWGAYGYFDTWVNDKTLGLWPHIHRATREMTKLADERLSAENLERRALNQLAREVLLASSSDWPFILTMGTMVPYAERRVRTHINRFNALLKQLRDRDIDETWLSKIEASDNIFPYIDYRAFASQQKRKRQESVF